MPKFITPSPIAKGEIVNLDRVFSIKILRAVIFFSSGFRGDVFNDVTWTFKSEKEAQEFYDGMCDMFNRV